jgi:hypothetical protein
VISLLSEPSVQYSVIPGVIPKQLQQQQKKKENDEKVLNKK